MKNKSITYYFVSIMNIATQGVSYSLIAGSNELSTFLNLMNDSDYIFLTITPFVNYIDSMEFKKLLLKSNKEEDLYFGERDE